MNQLGGVRSRRFATKNDKKRLRVLHVFYCLLVFWKLHGSRLAVYLTRPCQKVCEYTRVYVYVDKKMNINIYFYINIYIYNHVCMPS